MKRNVFIIGFAVVFLYFCITISLSSGYYRESTDVTMDAIIARLSGDEKKADSLKKIATEYRLKAERMEKFFKLNQ